MKSVYSNARTEVPLITFTVLMPLAWGLALLGFADGSSVVAALTALLLAVAGALASMLHLAKPLRAPLSISHIKTSWLSREIIAVGAFCMFLAGWVLFAVIDGGGTLPFLFELLAVAFGIVLLYAMAIAYRVRTRPAWNGPESLVELVACGVGGGSATVATMMSLQGETWPIWIVAAPVADAALCWLALRSRRDRLTKEEHISAPAVRKRMAQLKSLVRAVIVCKATAILLLACAAMVSGTFGAGFALCAAVLELASSILLRVNFYCMAVAIPHVVKLRRAH